MFCLGPLAPSNGESPGRRYCVRVKDVATSPDGIPIAFEVDGSGDHALVFVHGWSCDRSYWAKQLPAFETRYRVVAMDLAGHGESGSGRAD